MNFFKRLKAAWLVLVGEWEALEKADLARIKADAKAVESKLP